MNPISYRKDNMTLPFHLVADSFLGMPDASG